MGKRDEINEVRNTIDFLAEFCVFASKFMNVMYHVFDFDLFVWLPYKMPKIDVHFYLQSFSFLARDSPMRVASLMKILMPEYYCTSYEITESVLDAK